MGTKKQLMSVLASLLTVITVVTLLMVLTVPAAAEPADTGWRGEYFPNRYLSGEPRFVRFDKTIAFDWGLDSPDPRLGADNFSVRWTREFYFEAGRYRFTVETDDGVRFWVDNVLLFDRWNNGHKVLSGVVHLGEGTHAMRMEYYEAGSYAVAKLAWTGSLPPKVGNVVTWVPSFPSYSWVKVYRLAGDGAWVDIYPHGYASINPGGFLKIDGLPVEAVYGEEGQPYRIEQWIDGQLARSVGNFQRGEPVFRVRPYTDNYTPW